MSAATPQALFALLDRLGVAHVTQEHRPVFTVAEGHDIKAALPGAHTKNLFLKDKKGGLWLLCAQAETEIALNGLAKTLGAGRFSFGAPDLLYAALGVRPGSVTLFALMNDAPRQVRLVLDAALMAHDRVNFHPLTNAATTAISPAGVALFLRETGHVPRLIAFDAAGQGREIGAGAPAPD